jgi:hypothetical protein
MCRYEWDFANSMMATTATSDDDREEWNRLWSGRTQRRLESPIFLGVRPDPTFGELESVTIAEAPAEALERPGAERLWIETPQCPICGLTTVGAPRLFATLNLAFKSGIRYGQCVWAHPDCLDSCADTGMPAPIPW